MSMKPALALKAVEAAQDPEDPAAAETDTAAEDRAEGRAADDAIRMRRSNMRLSAVH